MFTSDFFFLRPWWLLAIVPALGIVILAGRSASRGGDKAWCDLVDPPLLAALTVKTEGSRRTMWYAIAFAVGLLAAIIAMAGPTWQKNDVPTVRTKQPTVVVLSLAQSMNADDVKPTRIVRARHKLGDILSRMAGGDAGLVIYADRPFVAAPLTSDARVIREMLPELSTDLLPASGNRLDLAIVEATNLLQQAGAKSGRIVVLANDAGTDTDAAEKAAGRALQEGYEVDAIGIGTARGANKNTTSGQATTGAKGQTTTAGYDENALRALTGAGGGKFVELTADSSDLNRVFATQTLPGSVGQKNSADMNAATWSDAGYWLLFLPVLLAPLAFRQNVLLVLPLFLTVGLMLPTEHAEAADWADFWNTPDQQAKTALAAKDYKAAAQLFEDSNWKASALYRAGDYAGAAQNFSGEEYTNATYNRANALAKAAQLQPALEAYNEHLKKFPTDKDAQFNHDLVEKLLQQQQQKEPDQNQEQDSEDAQQKDQEQKSENSQQKQQSQSAGDDESQQNQEKQSGTSGQNAADSGQSQQPSEDKPQAQNGKDSEQQDSSGNNNGQAGGESGAQSQQASQSTVAESPATEAQQSTQNEAGEANEQKDPDADANQSSAAGSDPQQDQQAANNGVFSKAMDEALQEKDSADNSSPEPNNVQPANTPGLNEQEQANEQLLRSVPDDPSGLLRARIYQHYALQRQAN